MRKKRFLAWTVSVVIMLSFLPANFVCVSALSGSGFTIAPADGATALVEGTDYSYSDRVLTVKTTTPVVIGMSNSSTSTDEVIIADSTNGAVDITFDNISIDTAKDDAIELNGNNQATFHFNGTNTLKAVVAGVATNSTPLKITSEENGELIISGVKCGIGTAGSKPGEPLEIGGNIRITIPEGVENAIYNNINSVTFSGNPVIDADVAEYAVYGVGLEFLGGTFTIKNDSGFAISSGDGGGIYKDIIIKGNTDMHITEAKRGIHNKNADIIISENAKVKMYGGDGETKTACVESSGISCQDGDVNISGDALVDVFVEEDGIYSGAAIEIKDRAKVYIKCAYEGSSTQYAVHFDTTLDIKDNAVVDIESTTDKKVNGFDQSSGTVNISGNAAVNIDGANRGFYTKGLNISDSASLTVENSLDYALYKDVTVKPESGKAYMVKTGSSEETADTEYYTSEETIKRKSYWTYFHASPSAGIPVTITGTDQTITFDESPYDVSQMFVIDENAGEATYSIVDETGTDTGAGTLSGANLTVTKVGKIKIKIQTAANGIYLAGEATAVLTVAPEDLSGIFDRDGSDPSGNTYLIQNREDMEALSGYLSSGKTAEGITFKVTNDIDLGGSADTPWTPIGSEAVPFKGTFDGCGYAISGLYINNDSARYQGLFGYVGEGGTVKNLTVDGEVTGWESVGGVAGQNHGTLETCGSSVNVAASFGTSGGVAGLNYGDVKGCYNTGSVKFIAEEPSGAETAFGGVVGDNGGMVENCYNTGSVEGYMAAGGVVGNNRGSVKNNYNTGSVTGGAFIGGVAGQNNYAELINCYNIGSVTGVKLVDGIVGDNYDSVVENCFCLAGSAADTVNGRELTEEELEDQSIFENADWDFGGTWAMDSWLGRPVLQSPREYCSTGTKEDPYLIPDLKTLERFRDKVNAGNSYEGIYIKLAADIDLSEKYGAEISGSEVSWTPIGSDTAPFEGIFSGGGHEISGLYINDSTAQYQGLFGYLGENGRIENLSVSGKITAKQYAGGIVGYNLGGSVINCENNAIVSGETGIGGIAGVNAPSANIAATIESCRNNGDISAVDGPTDGFIGGIAGTNSGDGSVITDCQNYGDIFSNGEYAYVGGIAGCNYHRIENCTNEGTVSAMNNASCVGGIAGSNGGEIYGCASKATVTGGGSEILTCAGGIVGNNAQSGDHILAIENCYNEGAVTAVGNMAGGIAGYQTAGMIKNCYNTGGIDSENYISGGVVGYYTAGDIQNCYNTGALTGSYVADGVVGYYLEDSTEPAVENCYYNSDELTGGDTGAGVTGKTAAQFASGEVAYLLQGGQPAGGDGTIPQVWGQALSGDEPDVSPVLTADDDKTVYKVAFMVDGAEYAAAYANPNGTAALPQAPDSEVYDFVKWSQTADAEGTEFTAQTPVTGDMAVYAIGQEMFGGTENEKTIITTYGMGATQDLTAYMTYAGETDATGKFTYTITGGNKDTATANGNTVSASIADDTLTIPADTHADTYTLTITATEKTPVIVPFSVEYGTEPVTFDVTVVVEKADPIYDLPDNLTATYGQTLANVQLPEGFAWVDSTESVGNAGENTFKAVYTPTDTENYNTADVEITFTVEKADVTVALNTENPQGAGGNRSVDLVASVTGVTGGEIPTGTVVFYDGDTAISEDIVIADGKAAFTWTQIPVGEHSLKAAYSGSANYQTAEGTASYNLDKDVQTELTITGPDTVIYGDEPFTLTVSGGSGTGAVSYAVAGESVVYDETNGTFTVVKTGESTITITKAADEDYNEATAVLTITVNPAAPILAEGAEVTAERVRRGNSLSTSEITGTVNGLDGQPLEGVWTWKNDREMDETGTFEETAVFTPADTNYAPFETTVSVTVYRPSTGGGSLTTRYTVTFDTQGGSKVSSKTVNRNTAVSEPAEPTREGYIFEGWFTDKDCTEAYDFSTRVTKDITLYAKWTEGEPEEPDNPTDPDEPDNPDEPEPPAEWENPYSDVAESDWFYDAVKYADENGLFAGTAETTFAPEESLTRAMLVTVLWRAEGQPVTNYLMTFADVDAGAYYGEAVRWAASEGIVKGYSDVEFAPDDLITREQIAAIMQRYADFKGIAADETADLARFTDAAQVSDWAVGNMQWAVGTGLISGRGDGSLAPQDNTTRAEAAAILMRFLEK